MHITGFLLIKAYRLLLLCIGNENRLSFGNIRPELILEISRDKTMDNKFMYIPNNDKQN